MLMTEAPIAQSQLHLAPIPTPPSITTPPIISTPNSPPATTSPNRRSEALEAARRSALKLGTSVLELVGCSARLYYEDGSPNPTLDPAPIMFRTPTEEKALHEKRQLETLQKTIYAKKCWQKVSELKREKIELERVLTALQGNPSIIIGSQFKHRIESMCRLKESNIDVAVHTAQLAETELQASKMIEHEERVVILHAKIACVERLKKEQCQRLKEENGLNNDINTLVIKDRDKQRFFCDCFQGLSTWYSKCFLQRGWYPYPSEEWFVTESTKLQIYSPLAKSTVDYCDTTSFSKCHSLLWEGGEWLEDKAKLGIMMKDTTLMPPTLIVPGGGWNGEIKQDMLCCVSQDDILKWLDIENSGITKFFAKDSSRNYGTGVNVCRNIDEVKKVISATPNESFVVQEAIEPQMLIDGYRFGVRVYLAAVALPSPTPEIQFYTYTDGWITRPAKPKSDIPNNKNEDKDNEKYDNIRNISRDRHHRLKEWNQLNEFMPSFRNILKTVLNRLKTKINVKENVNTFELFGVDFIIGLDKRIWLIEVNRSPRQMESDLPMLHSLLNIVFNENKTPISMKDESNWWKILSLDEEQVEATNSNQTFLGSDKKFVL